MRVLVLDSSGLLPWVVRHSAPPEVEVESACEIEAAEHILRERHPDAVVVSMPPAHLPWCAFQHLCATARPPIPVLYESYLHDSPAEAGLDPGDGYAVFLPKPAAIESLRAALAQLLAEARRCAEGVAGLEGGAVTCAAERSGPPTTLARA